MTTQKKDKKEQIWLALFVYLPIGIFWASKEEFATDFITKLTASLLLCGLGGGLGYLLYSLTKPKSTIVRIISLSTFLGLSIFTLTVINNLTKPVLQTCEICGCKAIKPNEKECQACGSSTWEIEKNNMTFKTKSDWIKEEQLFLFSIDSLNQKIDFYAEEPGNPYEIDKNWKPIITEQEILNDFAGAKPMDFNVLVRLTIGKRKLASDPRAMPERASATAKVAVRTASRTMSTTVPV